jgi:RNA polymerase sigma-70 factor (ECF subfamily)
MMADVSDADLVRRCQADDKAAFTLLVSRHLPRVKRLISAMLRNPAEVDDLLQESFLQAYLGLDQLRDPARFRAWVYSIAVNLARMRLRSYARRFISWEEWNETDRTALDDQPSPEPLVEQQEIIHRLNQAIADLPPAEREALLLVYRDGLSHQETADRLGTSLGAVKVRVHRGRHRLQAILQPGGEASSRTRSISTFWSASDCFSQRRGR